MKLPYSWLSELVDYIPPADEVAETLTMRGFEVEEVASPGEALKDVVVAKIVKMAPHPNADKLTLCQVTDGENELEIVCGAKNMKEGDKVALAYSGTVLPGGLKLERRKIRGVVSNGMLCSERELQLGDDHAGIIILPESCTLGARMIDEMGLNDQIFDINVTPNRPDGLSAIGIAREIAAAHHTEVLYPDHSPIEPDVEPDYVPSIKLEDQEWCPRYTGLIIKDIKIGPSPDWLVKRLEACGVRSVNNVVDATNLVLMEYGQPLHAFDLDKLEEERIVVRRGRKGEHLVSIDGEDRILDENMLVIADAKQPCAIAGVMGGLDSEVGDDTTSLLLESAFFEPTCIRRTSKRLGLSSEASYRFERAVDWNMVIPASYRCARLILELAGGKVCGKMGMADTKDKKKIKSLSGKEMVFRFSYCDRLLGKEVPRDAIEDILKKLQFNIKKKTKDKLTIQIPSFRLDVCREADLVEEVARCFGYNAFSPTLPLAPVKAPEPQAIDREMINLIRRFLSTSGLDEAVTYSFGDKESMKAITSDGIDYDNAVTTIQNPINMNEATMRTSMLVSLLSCAKRNCARGNNDFGLFEVARTYLPSEEGHEEIRKVGGLIVGVPDNHWRNTKKENDFFDLKGIIEELLSLCFITCYRLLDGPECLHPKRSAMVEVKGQPIGWFGELHPQLVEQYELSGRVLVFEFELQPLSDAYRDYSVRYRPFSMFPAMTRDLALLMPEGVPAKKVESVIRNESGELLENMDMFDYYCGKQIKEGFVSAGFRMTYRSVDGTLKDEEVDQLIEKILKKLNKELDVTLRA